MSPWTIIAGLVMALVALLSFTVHLLLHGPPLSHRGSRPPRSAVAPPNAGATARRINPYSLLRPRMLTSRVALGIRRASKDELFSMLASMARAHCALPLADGTFGDVLDSGTGDHSLQWILSLATRSWTAVTADAGRHASMAATFARHQRIGVDEILLGNWLDAGLLVDPVTRSPRVFDVVLDDYLLGAVEGFSPHFQPRIYRRLRPHVRGALLLVGLEPYPDLARSEELSLPESHPERVIRDAIRLRDAALVAAGRRPYREYPLAWIERVLRQSGFRVAESRSVPLAYGPAWVKSQVDVAERFLGTVSAAGFEDAIRSEARRIRALAAEMKGEPHVFGAHHVLCAVPVKGWVPDEDPFLEGREEVVGQEAHQYESMQAGGAVGAVRQSPPSARGPSLGSAVIQAEGGFDVLGAAEGASSSPSTKKDR